MTEYNGKLFEEEEIEVILGPALEFVLDIIKEKRAIIMEAVKKGSDALHFLSQEVREDSDFIIEAVEQRRYVFQQATKELKNDNEIIDLGISGNIRKTGKSSM